MGSFHGQARLSRSTRAAGPLGYFVSHASPGESVQQPGHSDQDEQDQTGCESAPRLAIIVKCRNAAQKLPRARVEADLRRRIAAGEWNSGQALPSVPALAERCRGCPRNRLASYSRAGRGWAREDHSALGDLPGVAVPAYPAAQQQLRALGRVCLPVSP